MALAAEINEDEPPLYSSSGLPSHTYEGVSVVIPAFNAQATLDDTLRSLARQTYRSWEAIVIDDGSTDGTAEIAAAWAARDKRLSWQTQQHAGVAAARNRGLRCANRRWILFLDSDDWLDRRALSRLCAAAQAAPEAGVIVGRTLRVTADGRRWPYARCDLSEPFTLLCCEGAIPIHSALVRRSVALEAGGFDESLRTSEDWDFWQRIARAGVAFRQVDEVVALYRSRPGSLSKQVVQVAADALVVMRRGHAPDPRVTAPSLACTQGGPHDALPSRELYFVLWSAARAVAVGEDPAPLAAMLSRPVQVDFDPADVGELMAAGMADILACRPADLRSPWPRLEPKLRAWLTALFPDRDRARARALALGVVEARLNGGRCGEPNVYQLEAPLREAQPAPGGLVLQLRAGERTLGVVAAPLLASAGAATLARFAAEQAPRLPLAAAVRALSPWSSPVFWRAALRELAQLRGLALKGQRRNRAMLKQILARRLRHAVRSGLDAEVRYRLRGALHQSDGDAHTAALAELRRQAELPPAPTVQSRSDLGSTTPGGRAQAVDRPESWDAFFDAADPWNYGGSHYERIKYEDTLELIPHAPSARALELACAEGHFTTRLATRVGALVASDISAKALARAQARAEGVDNVEFRQLDFMGQEIPGTYDLIVCSEVLYYAGDRLAQVAGKIADRLNPGGRLVMTHANQIADEPEATGFDWGHSFGAKTICEVFAAVPGLILETEIRRPLYRVQSFVKADGATGYAEPRREQRPLTVELERHVARNVVWGGGVSRIAAFGREVATSAPILMYHRVAPTGPAALDRYRVSPDAFDAQIGALRRLGYWGVTPERLVEALSTARPLPGRPVMITVDDGYEDFRDFAWPILKRHDFPATLFVVSEKAGQRADWDADVAEPAPLLGWEDLARLAAEGVCIESHGGSHRPLTRLSVDDVYLELLRARRVIELVTGRAPTALCYPYGAQDGIVEQIARDCGYQLGFGVQQGHALITGDPWRLPRVEVSGHDDMATFLRKIGRPDTLKALRSLAV